MDERFTPEQLAAYWQVSPRTVRDRCQSGALRAFRVGDLWRIPADAVTEFEARHTTERGATPCEVGMGVATESRTAAVEIDGEYVPVVKGPVPWRDEVASPAAGRSRSAGKKMAGSQR